jgi:hypothetical protein
MSNPVKGASCLATLAPALVAGNMQHVELANQVAEDDRAVVGHGFRFGLLAREVSPDTD